MILKSRCFPGGRRGSAPLSSGARARRAGSPLRRALSQKDGQPAQAREQQQPPPPLLAAALDAILTRYWGRSPTSHAVHAFVQGRFEQPSVAHDHLAFRTFGVPGFGIASIGDALAAFGYTRQERYTFPRKRLLATWFAPPPELYDSLPRVFVSELQVEQLSASAQRIIRSYTAAASPQPTGFTPLAAWTAALTGVLPWPTPSWHDYQALLQESEYAAWVLANAYQLNHTALSVHRVHAHAGDLAVFAQLLTSEGFALNGEGGAVKASPDGALLQCSTVADVVDIAFADGQVRPIAGPYLEFVERRPLPQHAHLEAGALREAHRRDGFEAESADKIFESTALAAAGLPREGA